MKIFTCITAFFLLSTVYAQQGNNQERLDQMPPAVTETEVERDAKMAGKERSDKNESGKKEQKAEKNRDDSANKQNNKTSNTINTPNRKSSTSPEKQ